MNSTSNSITILLSYKCGICLFGSNSDEQFLVGQYMICCTRKFLIKKIFFYEMIDVWWSVKTRSDEHGRQFCRLTGWERVLSDRDLDGSMIAIDNYIHLCLLFSWKLKPKPARWLEYSTGWMM